MQRYFIKYSLIIFFIFGCKSLVFAQDKIQNVVNKYQEVIGLNTDTAFVVSASDFKKGDKAMLFQAKGADLYIDLTFDPWNVLGLEIDNINNTGHFEILIVESIDLGKNAVIFESEIEKSYDVGQAIQLIYVPEYEEVEVIGELTAKKWDGTTGGVLAIISNQSITLSDDVNVSGLGFRGSNPNDQFDYEADCGSENLQTEYDSLDYLNTTMHRAGIKGEGFTNVNGIYTKGYSANGNGGGGGNAKYSGGGGGSNIVYGGNGGYQFSLCPNPSKYRTDGGQFETGANEFYNYASSNPNPRITLGGGGGSSNQNINEGFIGTTGGDGGGIILIIADTIIGNGHSILANGESVVDTATAGAGGGGGGGAILLAINNFADKNLTIKANGGHGGKTFGNQVDSSSLTGPGGGGGRGVVWFSFDALPSEIAAKTEYNFGLGGYNVYAKPLVKNHGATQGTNSITGFSPYKSHMVLPLTGFLFNTVYNNQYICEGDIPQALTATRPKGGIGTYEYLWQSKTKSTTWVDLSTDSLKYQPGPLMDTTYFRRVVTSGIYYDTSKIITIFVHDKLEGNIIGDEQKICSSQSPNPLTGNIYSGGNNTDYQFQWEYSYDNIDFDTLTLVDTLETYSPGVLTDTTFYRRRIESGACISNSNPVLIMVLDPIGNNLISDNQDLCLGNLPSTLIGQQPIGGDNTTYVYNWEQSINGSTWNNASETKNEINYLPAALSDTIYFRRFVTSGAGLCESTSNTIRIDVLNPIENNIVLKSDTICGGDNITLTGLQPSKGNGAYSYKWISDQSTSLANAQDINFTSENLIQDTYFKRIAKSGVNDACVDTSDAVFIRVWNKIDGNTIGTSHDVCFGNLPDNVSGIATLQGGDELQYNYLWQIKPMDGNYTNLSGDNDLVGYEFTTEPEVGEYFIRRKVTSDVCIDYSDSIKLTVLPVIEQNTISTYDTVCYNNSEYAFETLSLSGGNSTYTYSWESSESELFNTGVVNVSAEEVYNYSGLVNKTYFRRIVNSSACIDTSNVFDIDIFDLPVSNVLNTEDTICAGETIDVLFELSGRAPWQITYQDETASDISVSIDEVNKKIMIVPGSSFDFSTLSVVDANNCSATDMTGEDKIIVYNFPSALAGEDITVCYDSAKLNGADGGEVLWEFNESEVLVDEPTNPKANAVVVSYGETMLKYNVYNWQCHKVDTLMLTFYNAPEKPFGGDDLTLDYGIRTTLEAESPIVGEGRWYDADTSSVVVFDDANDPTTGVSNFIRGEKYLLVWEVSNGNCEIKSDTISLVSDDPKGPQGFSPNDDGKNDFFVIRAFDGLEEGEQIKLRIYSRRGVEVYSNENYQNDWKGKASNGVYLPNGTYFYSIEILNTQNTISGPFTGFVVIRR